MPHTFARAAGRRAAPAVAALAVSIAFFTPAAVRADAEDDFSAAREALADRDWERAAQLFGAFRDRHPDSPLTTEAVLLGARARHLAGEHDAAVEALAAFLRSEPGGDADVRARLLLAEAHIATERFAEASDIYGVRLSFLQGDEYLATLTARYLEIADPAYEGIEVPDPESVLPRTILRHDYATALEYYRKARSIWLPPERADQIVLRIGRSLVELGRHGEAREELERLLAERGTTPARPALPDELEGEALYWLGRALHAEGERREAVAVLLRLEEEVADHELVPAAVRQVGAIRLELARSAPNQASRQVEFQAAVEAWSRFLERYPQHELAPEVALERAGALREFGDAERAVRAYEALVRDYPKDERAPTAQLAVAELEAGRQRFDAAIAALRHFLGTWTSDARWKSAQERLVAVHYEKGVHLLREEERLDAAREVFEALLADWPLSGKAPDVYLRLFEMALPPGAGRFGDPSVDRGPVLEDEEAREAYRAALAPLRTLAGKHPDASQAPAARLVAARILHHRLDALEEAIAEYETLVEEHPKSPQAAQARRALAELRERQLHIVTPRAFTTEGPWQVRVETRNITRLKFRAYRLDLEEYFRRKKAVGDITAVDVGVVEPTAAWEADVPGYRPFRRIEGLRDLEIDAGEAGAYILSVEEVPAVEPPPGVESGTPLLATTLLLRSDLAFVTKHSATGTLIWAFDERTGKPWSGARVLLADGDGVFAEGTTDEEGIWRHEGTEERGEDLRALAVQKAGDGIAGAHFALDRSRAGEAVAWGYSTRAHITTDRPLYRPRQTVHFRALLRKEVGGLYASSEGEEARVIVRNPLDVVLYQETLTANPFGAVHGSIELTEEPPLGEYRIDVRYREQDFTGTFRVEEYRKPEFAVDLETERSTYLPGEEVTGQITAHYLFGAPVVDAEIEYTVWEGPFTFDRSRFEEFQWFFAGKERERQAETTGLELVDRGSGRTDAGGEMDFGFQPPSRGDSRRYLVLIEATDLSRITVRGSGSFIVSREGLFVIARSHRKVYRPGDEVTVSFRTVDAQGLPVDARGELVVLRRPSGEETDEVVSETPFATRDGRADAKVTLERGGRYRVLFRTRDRAGTLCEGGARVQVAGDEPDLENEVRLLAGKAVYRQGETATLHVSAPVTGRHALITFEGAGVIHSMVQEVTERASEIEVTMREAFSPNVHVSIALPAKGQLLTSTDEVIVLQYLEVAVTGPREDVKPGAEVELEVEATDQGGRPVEAEFSLAVVDESIFEIQPSLVDPIKSHFYDQRRQLAVATGSSLSFRHVGVTRAVEEAVVEELAERARSAAPSAAAAGARPAAQARGAELRRRSSTRTLDSAAEAEGLPESAAAADSLAAGRDRGAMAPTEQNAFTLQLGDRADVEGEAFRKLSKARYAGLALGAAPEPVVPRIRRRFADTAHWSPAVRTGPDGKAQVKVKLPDNLTTWRATAVGSTRGHLFGDGTTDFRTSKGLLVRVQTPRFLTRKDRSTVATPVHNYRERALDVDLRVEPDGLELEGAATAGVEVGAGVARSVDWTLRPSGKPADALAPGRLTVRALTEVESDALERIVPVLPFGERHEGGASGLLVDRAVLDHELPADAIPGTVRFEVAVYPRFSDALLETVYWLRDFPYHCVEQLVSGFLPLIALQEALDRLGHPREDLRNQLDELVPKRIVAILNHQRPSGGWGWWGRAGGQPDPEMTALALLGLERARRAGYRVQPDKLEAGRRRGAQLAAAEDDPETRALLLYALSLAERASPAPRHELVRRRDALSSRALALLALAEEQQGEHGTAAELAALLAGRARELEDPGPPVVPLPRRRAPLVIAPDDPRHAHGIETTSWALLAIATVLPDHPAASRLAAGLLALRRGIHWGTTKASAAAVTALSSHFAAEAVPRAAEVELRVGGEVVDRGEAGSDTDPRTPLVLRVPPERLEPGRNRVEIVPRGGAQLAWSLRWSHWTPAEGSEAKGNLLRVTRRFEGFTPARPRGAEPIEKPRRDPQRDPRDVLTVWAPPTQVAGDEASWLVADEAPPPGHRIVREEDRPPEKPPEITEAAPGERFRVRLRVTAREDLDYVQIEDPIPAGCEVIADTDERFTGSFERHEVRDEQVVFFVTHLPEGTHEFTYLLRAVFPGSYGVLPAYASCMYQPGIRGLSADHALEIPLEAEPDRDGEEPTPDELLWIAEREYLELGGPQGRAAAIAPLLDRYLALRRRGDLAGPYNDLVLARLAALHLHVGRDREALDEVEALRRGRPGVVSGRGDLAAVARAYRSVEEYPLAVDWQQRLFDELYRRDADVRDTLFERDRELEAQTWGLRLVSLYPDSQRVVADAFELSRRWATIRVKEPDATGRTRERQLHREAVESLASFIAHHPASSFAPRAQYLVISNLQSLEAPVRVVEGTEAFGRRYPEDELLDDALYAGLEARFARGEHREVIEEAPELIEGSFRRDAKETGPSEYRSQARYLRAKSWHILGELSDAVEEYRKLAGENADAREALEHLTEKALEGPALVTIPLDESPELELEWKNIDKLEGKAYRVDLPLLFATHKSLSGVSSVDLTGIDPQARFERKLRDATFHRERGSIRLPADAKCAWMVALSADDQEVSSVIIRSDLEVELRREGELLRVHVLPRGKAKVRISSGDRIVATGDADARGIFEHPAPKNASVLVERDGHFALVHE